MPSGPEHLPATSAAETVGATGRAMNKKEEKRWSRAADGSKRGLEGQMLG
jgi:hypothetical protein